MLPSQLRVRSSNGETCLHPGNRLETPKPLDLWTLRCVAGANQHSFAHQATGQVPFRRQTLIISRATAAYRLVGFFMVLCPSSHGAPSRFLHDVLFGRPNG